MYEGPKCGLTTAQSSTGCRCPLHREKSSPCLGQAAVGNPRCFELVGLQALSAGEVWLNGEHLTASPIERRGIGFLFQHPVLYPTRDVAGNLRLGLPRHVPTQERPSRVAEALKEVGLEGFEQRTVEGLSGGEGQRVALARALLAEPKALLLDEPFSALDGSLRQRLVDTVRSVLKARQLPAVHVTHDADEAKAIADRCLVMEDGRLVEEPA